MARKSFLSKFRSAEPAVFLYAFGLILHSILIQQYIYDRASEDKGYNNTFNSRTKCVNDSEVRDEVCFSNGVNTTMTWNEGSRPTAQTYSKWNIQKNGDILFQAFVSWTVSGLCQKSNNGPPWQWVKWRFPPPVWLVLWVSTTEPHVHNNYMNVLCSAVFEIKWDMIFAQ